MRYMPRIGLTFLLCISLCAILQPAFGQEVTAGVVGTIADPSGAPITGVTVTVTDSERGTVRTVTTNESGAYNLSRLPVGTYALKASAPGFQTTIYPPFVLVLNQVARVDVSMKVGQVSETVEVSSAAPILKTESTQLDTVIDARTNVNLPLASRNYIQLTLLAPGSINPNPQTLTNAQRIDGAGRPYINGNREQSNNFLLDGMDNNQVSDNLVGYTPSVDAIQEFNMITQNASAEFGNFEGGIINATIKSGTNSLHGSVFEFFRNDKLNANQWQNGFLGPGNELPKPALRWNMFGAAVGGPIIKNKLFFFADYQGQRFDHPATTNFFNVLTDAERNGDFSALCTSTGSFSGAGGTCVGGTQLYNPFNVVGGVRQPFANDQIDPSLFDPVAVNLLASDAYPHATSNALKQNASYTSSSALNADQGDFKLDFTPSEKNHFFGRFSEEAQNNPASNSVLLIAAGTGNARIHNGVISWTHAFNSNLLNEVRVGANYVGVDTSDSSQALGNFGEGIGIAGANSPGAGMPALNFTGGNLTNLGSSLVVQLFHDTVFQYADNVIFNHGHHIFHLGGEFMRNRINSYYSGNNGQLGLFNFSGKLTGSTDGTSLGAGEADFMLGLPDTIGRGIPVTGGHFPTWGHRGNVMAAYVQDDWKATPTLTVNLGLRYEIHTPWVEVQDRQANFGLFSGDLEVKDCSKIPVAIPSYVNCVNSGNRALYNTYQGIGNWQPRIGLAWTPGFLGGRTVIRTAFSVSSYLEGTGTNLRLPLNPPFTPLELSTPSTTTNLPTSTTDQGFPSNPADPFQGATIRLWNPDIQPAMAQQWNISVQHALNNTTTMQVAYVGQRGTHMMVPTPYLQKELHPDGSITNSPFMGGNPTLQAAIGQISGTASTGSMDYHALQATLQRRYGNGLQYQVAYTYSKCLTDSSGYYGSWGGQTTPTSPYYQNLYDPGAEWGPCYYDTPHTLSSYVTYELPFGRGKRMGANMNPVVNAIVGNWQVSGIVSFHTGFPLTISGADNSNTNSRGARANCNGSPSYPETPLTTGGIQWFDPSIYSQPGVGTFGTCSVGNVRGPGLATGDLGLQKQFAFTETKRLELRGEFINVANHPILNSPGAGLGGGLGQVTNAQGERNIQLALKFIF